LKIFIVENHRDTLLSLRAYLEELGHQVASATTLEQALPDITSFGPDMLICDIGLPDGTGWELLQRVQLPKMPFSVAMSGFGMNADDSSSRKAGFRHHLLKPFRIGELDALLAKAAAESAKT